MLECRILTSEAEVESIAGEWRRLQAAVGRIPHTDYDWFDTWWRNIGKSGVRTLYIVTGRIDQRLVALLPLVVSRRKGMRILENVGKKVGYPCDILAESQDHAKVLWETVRQSRSYDFATIKFVDPDSACSRALASFARRRLIEKAPYLDLTWSDSKAWMASLSSNTSSQYKRRMRRLQEKGEVQFHVHTTSPVPINIVDEMIKQKTAWCLVHDKHGMFDQQGIAAFLRQLPKTAAGLGQLCLFWLQCGDHIIACRMAFVYHKTIYGFLMSYDSEWKAFAPSTLLQIHSISWAIDNGLHKFDFMWGDIAYKLRYASGMKECPEWTFSTSFPGRLMEGLFVALRSLSLGIENLREWKLRLRIFKPHANGHT